MMEKMNQIGRKIYQLPIINQVLELFFCLFYGVVLTIYSVVGGEILVNVGGFTLRYKSSILGHIGNKQMFTFYVLTYCFFWGLISIYKIELNNLKNKIKGA